jgi:hypothetical protein
MTAAANPKSHIQAGQDGTISPDLLHLFLDAPNVGTLTEGSSAEHGKPLLRRGRTRERGTRKAKIKAKFERSKTVTDQDLRP